MFSYSTLRRGLIAVLAATVTIFIASCGGTDDGLGRRFPVSGAVTYNGNPLEKGSISFVPDDAKGVGATGAIENGSYKLSTGGDNDGARAGKYKVTITAKEDATAKAKAEFEKARGAHAQVAGTEDLAYIPKQFLIKAQEEAKSLIPAGYGNVTTTTLTAEVKEQPNTIDFPLSDAEAPRSQRRGQRPWPPGSVVPAGLGIRGPILCRIQRSLMRFWPAASELKARIWPATDRSWRGRGCPASHNSRRAGGWSWRVEADREGSSRSTQTLLGMTMLE